MIIYNPAAAWLTHGPASPKVLRELKAKISSQSKKNFVLEKDVRYLDSRIALLIQNRMALEEVSGRPRSTGEERPSELTTSTAK